MIHLINGQKPLIKKFNYERTKCNIENEDQYINQIEKIYMR